MPNHPFLQSNSVTSNTGVHKPIGMASMARATASGMTSHRKFEQCDVPFLKMANNYSSVRYEIAVRRSWQNLNLNHISDVYPTNIKKYTQDINQNSVYLHVATL